MRAVFRLERGEAEEIIISVVAIAFALSVAFAQGLGPMLAYPKDFIKLAVISALTLGAGFVLHEMAHKFMAIRYGAYARFHMWVQGLVFMVIISFLGMVFAAPGAVYIFSRQITRKENGIISLAGPAMNIIIAVAFLFLALFAPYEVSLPFKGMSQLNVWALGAWLNLIVAMFNMLPLFPMDGSKVFMWSKAAWFAFVFLCFALGVVLLDDPSILLTYAMLIIISFILSGAFSFGRRARRAGQAGEVRQGKV